MAIVNLIRIDTIKTCMQRFINVLSIDVLRANDTTGETKTRSMIQKDSLFKLFQVIQSIL